MASGIRQWKQWPAGVRWAVGLALLPVAAVLVYYGGWALFFDMNRVTRMPQTSVVYDRNGYVVQRFYEQHRVLVEAKEIPEVLKQAVIATEDQRFYWHPGIDPVGLARAAARNLKGHRISSGASTITMQLARNSADMFERTLDRKLKEAFLAVRIELAYPKEKILTLYLNRIFFGRKVYGVGAAAEAYFWKKPADLSLAEAAMLAGIISGPNSFSPWRNPDKARAARGRTLARMREEGMITGEQEAAAAKEPLVLRPMLEFPASHAVSAVREELPTFLTRDQIVGGGLKIYTTLDLAFQKAAEEELEKGLVEVESAKGYPHITRAAWLKKHPEPPEQGDAAPPYLQGAFVALSNADGGVLAMVGGRDFDESPLNRATASRRQVGSTLKPLVYAAAFRDLGMTAFTRVDRTPFDLKRGAEAAFPGGGDTITVREALQTSDNYCAMRVGLAEGLPRVAELVKAAGGPDMPPYASALLGAVEFTPLELVAAYTMFPRGGEVARPYLIRVIKDAEGRTMYEGRPEGRRVVSEQVAYQIHDLLKGVVDEGTAAGLRRRGVKGEVAGKTGTTNEYKDSWFMGYTAAVTAGVWIGLDRPAQIIPGGYASRIAIPAWARIMALALKQGSYAPTPIPPPPGLRLVQGTVPQKVLWFFTKQVPGGRQEYVRADQPRPLAELGGSRMGDGQGVVARRAPRDMEPSALGDFFRRLFGGAPRAELVRRPRPEDIPVQEVDPGP